MNSLNAMRRSFRAHTNPLFEEDFYVFHHPDATSFRTGVYDHFCRFGIAHGYNPNPYFDTSWYLEVYPDVKTSGRNPLDHYFEFGRSEGRDPSPRFSTLMYLVLYPDVKETGWNPLEHFLRHGRSEGREAPPAIMIPRNISSVSLDKSAINHLEIKNICNIIEGNNWPNRLYRWMGLLIEAKDDRVQEAAVQHLLNRGSTIIADQQSTGFSSPAPSDFFPSGPAIAVVQRGLKKRIPHLRETDAGVQLLNEVGGSDAQISNKIDSENALVSIGSDISARLWRQISAQAKIMAVHNVNEKRISEDGTFSLEWLNRLSHQFPIHPFEWAAFFNTLYQDLYSFIAIRGAVEGGWGGLYCENGELFLKSPQKSLPKLPRRKRRESRMR